MNISLAAEPLFNIGSFVVTNTLVVAWVIILFLGSIVFLLNRNLREVPKGLQNLIEAVIEAIVNMVQSVTQDRKKTIKFLPIVATIFIFVILSNWIEIVPGLGTIGIYKEVHGERELVPFIRSSSADLNLTLAIALVSVISTQILGIAGIGLSKYAGKFFISPFKKPYFIGTFVGLLELISEFAKIISFTFRLFGNIFAGEVLLLVVLTLAPYIVPLPFLFLEIFVGFVQALVFSMLTLVFLTMATTYHEEH